MGLPRGAVVKNPPANAGERSSIPESGRSPGKENENPLQYSCLGNSRTQGAWRVPMHEVAKEWHTV